MGGPAVHLSIRLHTMIPSKPVNDRSLASKNDSPAISKDLLIDLEHIQIAYSGHDCDMHGGGAQGGSGVRGWLCMGEEGG